MRSSNSSSPKRIDSGTTSIAVLRHLLVGEVAAAVGDDPYGHGVGNASRRVVAVGASVPRVAVGGDELLAAAGAVPVARPPDGEEQRRRRSTARARRRTPRWSGPCSGSSTRLRRPSGVRTSMTSGNAPVARERDPDVDAGGRPRRASWSIVSPSGNSSFGLLQVDRTCSGHAGVVADRERDRALAGGEGEGEGRRRRHLARRRRPSRPSRRRAWARRSPSSRPAAGGDEEVPARGGRAAGCPADEAREGGEVGARRRRPSRGRSRAIVVRRLGSRARARPGCRRRRGRARRGRRRRPASPPRTAGRCRAPRAAAARCRPADPGRAEHD